MSTISLFFTNLFSKAFKSFQQHNFSFSNLTDLHDIFDFTVSTGDNFFKSKLKSFQVALEPNFLVHLDLIKYHLKLNVELFSMKQFQIWLRKKPSISLHATKLEDWLEKDWLKSNWSLLLSMSQCFCPMLMLRIRKKCQPKIFKFRTKF